MTIDKLKRQLEIDGYHIRIASKGLIVGHKTGSDFERDGMRFIGFDGFCLVMIENNKIKIEHANGSINYEEVFTSISQAVRYIKSTFPL